MVANTINKLNTDGFVVLDLGNYFPNAQYNVNVKTFIFNGGEPHIVIDEHSFKNVASEYLRDCYPTHPIKVLVTCRAKSTDSFFTMLAAVNALRNIGIKNISLFIPYFPGARQDRVNHFGEPFTAKLYADLVNGLNLENVCVVDPHSLVVSALLNNFVRVSHDLHVVNFVNDCLKSYSKDTDEICLVAPDEGALKKTQHFSVLLAERVGKRVSVVFAGKTRYTSTGEITDYKLYGDFKKDIPIFVFDDICDGGRTFTDLATLIENKNMSNPLYLFTTHGIFSKGFEELFKHYSAVGCTESFYKIDEISKKHYVTIYQYGF